MHIVAPSILAANFLNLEKDIQLVNESAAEWVHLDVMDGVFVPNISYGMPIIKAIKSRTNKFLDVHLMIVEPERYIVDFKNCGADLLSIHYEACTHLHRSVTEIKNQGMKAGVVLNPHTPVDVLKDIVADVDLVLLMSVNPGFGGQSFIENTYHKITELKELIAKKNSKALIEVDGGVSLDNYKNLLQHGANILVAGSAIFKSNNPSQTIADFMTVE